MGDKSIAASSSLPAQREFIEPAAREMIEIPFYNGSKVVRVKRYKDDVMKEFRKNVGLGISVNSNGL